MDNEVSEKIVTLRQWLSLHSYVYYIFWSIEPKVSDSLWDQGAMELARLQEEHGYQHGFEDDLFKDWDGSTGMHIARLGQKIYDEANENNIPMDDYSFFPLKQV